MMYTLALIIGFLVALWVYNDAVRRGLSGGAAFGWALGSFLLMIVFLPIYLIVRPKVDGRVH